LEYEVGLLVNSGNEGLRIVVQSVVRWLAAGQVVVVMWVVVVKRVAGRILAVGDVNHVTIFIELCPRIIFRRLHCFRQGIPRSSPMNGSMVRVSTSIKSEAAALSTQPSQIKIRLAHSYGVKAG
jgi:hypothetical protein